MKEYYLFLDETKPNGLDIKHFSFGGCIIEKSVYEDKIIKSINEIKTNIIRIPNIILHESEIRNAKSGNYLIFRQKEIRDNFWEKMKDIFQEEFFTICASINAENYKKYYNFKYSRSLDFITLQILLENFAHFLEKNNGKGTIYIESRDAVEDKRLASHYHIIMANGTLFLDKYIFQERLTTINFVLKSDNNVGLQLADFIPNPINRNLSGLSQKTPTLLNEIENKLYCGGFLEKSRFGLKNIL